MVETPSKSGSIQEDILFTKSVAKRGFLSRLLKNLTTAFYAVIYSVVKFPRTYKRLFLVS
jgi:hypothetical protein